MNTEQKIEVIAYKAESNSESAGVLSSMYWLTEAQAIENCPQIGLASETVSTTKWRIELPESLLPEILEDGLHYNRIYIFDEPKILRE